MGQSHPSHANDPGTFRNIDSLSRTVGMISEKEYMYIAIRSDIEEAITKRNVETMMILESEINKHISDLKTLRNQHIQMPRIDKLVYNYELCLAKLGSFLNYDAQEKEENVSEVEFEEMCHEFADVNRPFICGTTVPNSDESVAFCDGQVHSTSKTPNNTPNNDEPMPETLSTEDTIETNGETAASTQIRHSTLGYVKKEDILLRKQMKSFQDQDGFITDEDIQKELSTMSIERNSKEYERSHAQENSEHNNLYPVIESQPDEYIEMPSRLTSEELYNETRINELEIMYDSCCTEADYKNLEDKVFSYVNLIHTSTSKNRSMWVKKTIELLEKIKATRRALFQKDAKDKASASDADKSDYLTLWESQTASKCEEDGSSINKNDDNNSIYSNFEVIRKHLSISSNNIEEPLNHSRSNEEESSSRRPETIYSNVEVIREHKTSLEQRFLDNIKILENAVHKPPVPNPRRHEDKLMRDLATYWQRLCDIGEQDTVSLEDVRQVEDMQRYLEVAHNMFMTKIESVQKKYKETCDTVDV